MIGEIGTLKQGRQVGGIFNWSIDGSIKQGREGKWASPKVFKSIKANSYWLLTIPDNEIFEADFYQRIGCNLVLMDSGRVKVLLPDTETLNRTLYAPLTLRWIWDD